MDSGIHGLGAVAWTNAWNSAAPETGLRVPVDPSRLLDLLRGLPVARALLSDLQEAESAGRSVELVVSPDRQVAEIVTSAGHYVLTAAARNAVLAAFLGRPQGAPATGASPAGLDRPDAAQASAGAPKGAPSSGVLWESPTLANRAHPPAEAIALPWLGADAHLEVRRDPGGGRPDTEPQSRVHHAKLHLQLRALGRLDVEIRLCGNTVAVSVDCSSRERVAPELAALQRRLSEQGLTAAHVGLSTEGSAP
jgi:hypothetical protein